MKNGPSIRGAVFFRSRRVRSVFYLLLHRRRPSYQLLALDIYGGWCLYPDPGAPAIAGQDDYPDAAVYENRLSLAAIENQHWS